MTTRSLHLAKDLSLPLEAVTEKLAFLGRTGSGKTYGAMKLAELMLEAGAQIGALDPVGVWRALRVPAEKGGRSFDVVVFGGLYGDLPLEPTEQAGALVADLVCDRGLSFVLDVSQFIPSEQQRFVRAFADRFFHRKKSAPSAVHLFLEECQEFIPENPSGEEAKTLGVMQRLWKLGRNFGIGGSLISQRPQEIAKKALNMSGTLFAFQMTGPQERAAVRKWVANQGIAVDIEGVLQKLRVGEPHVESPTFLEVSKTVQILPRVTADLSSTPKVGASTAAKRALTPIDVEQLKTQMAATIEKAKADDPKELRKELAKVRAELAAAQRVAGKEPAKQAASVQKPVLTDGDRALLQNIIGKLTVLDVQAREIATTAEKRADRLVQAALSEYLNTTRNVGVEVVAGMAKTLESKGFQQILAKLATVQPPAPAARPASIASARATPPRPPARTVTTPANGDANLTPAKQKILNALAFLSSIGVSPADKTQLALFVGVSPTSGAYFNNLGALRSAGLIDYPSSGTAALTAAGAAVGVADNVPTTTADLHVAIQAKLPPAKWKILDALIRVYPNALTKDDLADRIGVSPTSGAYFNNLGSLRSLGLLDYPRASEAVALPVLFLGDVA